MLPVSDCLLGIGVPEGILVDFNMLFDFCVISNSSRNAFL